VVLLIPAVALFSLGSGGCPETIEGVDYFLFGAVKDSVSSMGIPLVEIAVDNAVVEYADSSGKYDYVLLSRGSPPADTVLVSYSKVGFKPKTFAIPGDLEIRSPSTKLDVVLSRDFPGPAYRPKTIRNDSKH